MSWPRLAVIESPTFAPALFERPWQVLTPIEPLLSGLGDRADEIAQPSLLFLSKPNGASPCSIRTSALELAAVLVEADLSRKPG
jgi:hypothetical protein